MTKSTGVSNPRRRHRWKATSDHFFSGPKYWECIHCGLHKVTEWEEKPEYYFPGGRKWHRFAPPCPPTEEVVELREKAATNTDEITQR